MRRAVCARRCRTAGARAHVLRTGDRAEAAVGLARRRARATGIQAQPTGLHSRPPQAPTPGTAECPRADGIGAVLPGPEIAVFGV